MTNAAQGVESATRDRPETVAVSAQFCEGAVFWNAKAPRAGEIVWVKNGLDGAVIPRIVVKTCGVVQGKRSK